MWDIDLVSFCMAQFCIILLQSLAFQYPSAISDSHQLVPTVPYLHHLIKPDPDDVENANHMNSQQPDSDVPNKYACSYIYKSYIVTAYNHTATYI